MALLLSGRLRCAWGLAGHCARGGRGPDHFLLGVQRGWGLYGPALAPALRMRDQPLLLLWQPHDFSLCVWVCLWDGEFELCWVYAVVHCAPMHSCSWLKVCYLVFCDIVLR